MFPSEVSLAIAACNSFWIPPEQNEKLCTESLNLWEGKLCSLIKKVRSNNREKSFYNSDTVAMGYCSRSFHAHKFSSLLRMDPYLMRQVLDAIFQLDTLPGQKDLPYKKEPTQ